MNALRSPELRKKLLFTAFILAIFRFGSFVPVPGVDAQTAQDLLSGSGSTNVLQFLNLFAGGALTRFAVFALGIMPYITASIIMQLMTVVIPKLEQLQKEGESGYAKITQYTRYFTVALAVVQSFAFILYFKSQNVLPDVGAGEMFLMVLSLTAGTALVMWLGELITQRGIGNGMSLLIFAAIVSSVPGGLVAWWEMPPISRILVGIVALAVTVGVVYMNEGVRRIPIQYARRVVGRRMTSGGMTYMPIRVNMAGVIPVIFAAAVTVIPSLVAELAGGGNEGSVFDTIAGWMDPNSYFFILIQSLLIGLFTYFYTAIQFNPVDQAENLKKYGGFVPGVRPGRPTAIFLDRVVTRLTLPGAVYLALVAALPNLMFKYLPDQTFFFGGTSLLIVVGVALDTMRQTEAQLLQRQYEGFLR